MEGESSLKIYTPDLFSCLLKVCQNEKEGDIAAKETFKPWNINLILLNYYNHLLL